MGTDVPIRSRLFIYKLSCFQMIANISWITGMGKMDVSAYPSVYIRLFQEPVLQRTLIGVLGQGGWVWAGV